MSNVVYEVCCKGVTVDGIWFLVEQATRQLEQFFNTLNCTMAGKQITLSWLLLVTKTFYATVG